MKKYICTENIAAIIFFIVTFAFPIFSDAYTVDNFSNFYITVLLSLSLTLIWGFTGIFSFGQAAFYGLGAYIYGIISVSQEGGTITILAAVAAVILSGVFAGILGTFIFYGKISNIFTGIITMCVATVLETFMTQTSDGKWKVLGVSLGGYNGLNNIPPLAIGDFEFTQTSFYILVAVVLLIVYLVMRKIEVSKIGYSLFGIRENQVRSELFGYNTAKIQTLAFAFSGALAGLAGVLFASWSSYVVPSNFSVATSTIAVVMVAVAGKRSVTGAMIMTLIYSWFTQFLASTGSEYSQLILGILLILVVLFIPDGVLVALFKKSDEFFAKIFSKNKAISK